MRNSQTTILLTNILYYIINYFTTNMLYYCFIGTENKYKLNCQEREEKKFQCVNVPFPPALSDKTLPNSKSLTLYICQKKTSFHY